jgi:hypothetical protein
MVATDEESNDKNTVTTDQPIGETRMTVWYRLF